MTGALSAEIEIVLPATRIPAPEGARATGVPWIVIDEEPGASVCPATINAEPGNRVAS